MFMSGMAPSEIDRELGLVKGTAHDVISYRVWPAVGVRGPHFDSYGNVVFVW